jgi:hypothetical protein
MLEISYGDMPPSARHCAMQIAENEKGVIAWRDTLPPTHRPCIYPQNLWDAYRITVLRRPSKRKWQNRLKIDEATALRAREDVRLALRDVARRQRYNISENVLEDFAYAALISCLNALDIAIPQALVRRVAFVNGSGKHVAVPPSR